jgi:hypothetical protein
LKQIDYNGEFTLSSVRSVIFEAPTELSVYPNPAKSFVTVNRGKNAVIQITNELGQNVFVNQDVSENSTILHLTDLNSGVYYIRIQDEEGVQNRKIIIMQD